MLETPRYPQAWGKEAIESMNDFMKAQDQEEEGYASGQRRLFINKKMMRLSIAITDVVTQGLFFSDVVLWRL